MAHEITVRKNGQAEMFYVGDAPWHKLGTKVEQAPSIEEAIKLAGLNWEVIKKPLFTSKDTADGSQVIDRKVHAVATVRKDNGRVLGVVGEKYQVLQNTEAFNFFQPFIDSGTASLETAGSLKGGSRVWILAKINLPAIEVTEGDAVEQFILLSNSHDGTLAIRVGFVAIRVVCQNTLSMAHEGGRLVRIKHQGNPQEALKAIQEVMDVARREFVATVEQYKAMAKMELNQADLEKFVRITFDLKTKEEETRTSKIMEGVSRLFQGGRGNDMDGVKGTLWAAYNAATEYIQYERGKSDDVRLDSTWFGTGASLNKKAFETALDMLKEAA